jgi:hypothetical protein
MDPLGILVAFGLFKIFVGLYFRIPAPIQPMKAIGGMAGHIRFGARTGGALVMLGILVLLTGLFLSDSVSLLFQVFPRPILGVILFFAGVELALVVRDIKLRRENLFVMLVTAGIAMWNMGVAYLSGLLLYYGLRWRWFGF